MNTQLEMILKTGILLVILQTVHSAVEKRTNRTCTGYHPSEESIVSETTMTNEKDLPGIGEDTGSSESSVVLDPHASTTLNYENSKLLFNYIVPANAAPPKIEKKEEKPKEKNEEKNVEKNEEKEDDDNDEIEEEEEEAAATEDGEDEEEEEEEDEEAEEYRKEDLEDEDGNAYAEDYEEAQDDQNEHATADKEDEREEEDEEDEEEEEEEEEEDKEEEKISSASDHEDKEENQQEEEEVEEEDSGRAEEEEKTEKGTTSAPIMPWRQSYPAVMREVQPRLDFTTAQPYEDPRPVSYASVVYNPQGNSKTELSGSFYKKPLKFIPRSKLFRKELENISEDTKTVQVTTAPVVEERSIQASLQEEDDDFDPIKHHFDRRPMRVFNPKVPRHSFDWALPRAVDEDEESRKFNGKTRQQYLDKSNREKYYEQVINTRFGAKEKDSTEEDENYESEAQDLMQPQAEWKHETVQKDVLSEDDETDSGEDYKPTKDRNQLYEYLVENMPSGQRTSENKALPLTYTTTTPKREEIPTTVLPENKTPEPVTVKPYSFGTITTSNQAHTFNNPDNSDILYNQIVSDIQSMFTPTTPKPTNYEQHFLPSHGHCRTSPPNHDSANYETFIQPSHFHRGRDEREHEDEEEDGEAEEEEENPMPKRLPMKTYIIKKNPVQKPSGVKVTVYPVKSRPHMMYREAKPVSYRNSVYSGPVPNSNTLVRKIFYYEPKQKVLHYSPTNQIFRVARPQTKKLVPQPSGRMLIIRKL